MRTFTNLISVTVLVAFIAGLSQPSFAGGRRAGWSSGWPSNGSCWLGRCP